LKTRSWSELTKAISSKKVTAIELNDLIVFFSQKLFQGATIDSSKLIFYFPSLQIVLLQYRGRCPNCTFAPHNEPLERRDDVNRTSIFARANADAIILPQYKKIR
jgi:hypothetical protein